MITNRQLFLSSLAQTSTEPMMLEIERAEGVYLYDSDGKEYIDLISGINVSYLGHNHPVVTEAVKLQADRFMHLMVYGEYVQLPQVQFSKLLVDLLPEGLECVYFVNSGSEAVEGALKTARKFTGRGEIIYFKGAYHGSTYGALSVMGNDELKTPFGPLLPATTELAYDKIDELIGITENTACVIAETIQGESGVTVPDRKFLLALRKRCTDTGALLILDEVQTGLGRTGSTFAFEQFDITPDILLLAKSLGGGMPLGAFIASHKVMSVLAAKPALGHITTFGGHPVSCAAGHAALQAMLASGLMPLVKDKEAQFRKLLSHPAIKSLSSCGLMMSLEFENGELNKRIINHCIKNGVVVDWFLFAEQCLRIAPPLTISGWEIHKACEVILASIDAADKTEEALSATSPKF